MKTKFLSISVIAAVMFTSCGSGNQDENSQETTVANEEITTIAETYDIDAENSTLIWRGEVAGVYGHDGVANVKSGIIIVDGGVITGGEITIDMTTIAATDSASFKDVDGGRISDLEGHLTTGDFFNTADFPTSTFVITSVDGTSITGNLTVRGKTNEENFTVESSDISEGSVTVKGALVFDRQKYDVAWVHYMKDMVLSDDITLTMSITATR